MLSFNFASHHSSLPHSNIFPSLQLKNQYICAHSYHKQAILVWISMFLGSEKYFWQFQDNPVNIIAQNYILKKSLDNHKSAISGNHLYQDVLEVPKNKFSDLSGKNSGCRLFQIIWYILQYLNHTSKCITYMEPPSKTNWLGVSNLLWKCAICTVLLWCKLYTLLSQ